ncbi:MAG: AAA family ATPase [Dehalococcoidia bacterium]|nr:AAA family ATPase [Dehalococcoidia bacterium]
MGTVLSCVGSTNLEHLFAELNRIDLKLRLQVMQARSRDSYWEKDELRGLYISDRELSALITSGFIADQDSTAAFAVDPDYQSLLEVLAQVESEIETSKSESLPRGVTLRPERLANMFQLTAFEKDVILLCILPELDLKYERLFGYVQDDVTKRRPTVALALNVLCSSVQDRLASRRAFSSQGPLIRYHLVSLHDDTPGKHAPLLATSLKLDDRIRDYLLEPDEIDANLLYFVHRIVPRGTLDDVVLDADIKGRLVRLTDVYKDRSHNLTWYFHGAEGTGKRSTAEALCHGLGIGLLVADVNRMLEAALPFETAVQLLCREAMLQDAAIYWHSFDALFDDGVATQLKTAMAEIDRHPGLVFLAGNRDWNTDDDWQNRLFMQVEFSVPDYGQREYLWRTHLDTKVEAPDALAGALAGKFQLSGGQIRGAASMARNLALWRDSGVSTADELLRACRQKSNKKLSELARKLEPRYVWNDIVLPSDRLEQLEDIYNYVKYRHVVYGEWGFRHKLSLGEGLNILFAGPSGTGKTLAAEIIAGELCLDLYKIDLAMVVSKYIGETEKNLDKIFKEAQDSNGILFFDEADAIFGKRSEVSDSHDRYANIEIAYLLQKTEDYQGTVILATNLRSNLDEAFARRMHFSVEFPFPEEEDRYRIWQRAFPEAAPLADDTDLAFMARQFRITGGNIKNIALSAAFLAAPDGSCITMEKLIRATKREYQKMGKLCTEGDFARYFELVKG